MEKYRVSIELSIELEKIGCYEVNNPRPIYDQVFDWLEERYNIYHETLFTNDVYKYSYTLYYKDNEYEAPRFYLTKRQAKEEAIKQVIEIIKNKKDE